MKTMSFGSADILMQQAVKDRVFPGGALLVSKQGRLQFFKTYGVTNNNSGRPLSPETVFDLASLTKPLATTLAIMRLVQQRRLALSDSLGALLPSFAATTKSAITLEQLLNHTSGMPDHREYFKQLRLLPTAARIDALQAFLVNEALINPIGQKTVYSDLGFMVLGWIIEARSEMRLDRFVSAEIYQPLGLRGLFFIDLHGPTVPEQQERLFAATEECPWRKRVLEGMVHDDNAYAMGGVAGHAGLFGTAADVHALVQELLASVSGWVHQGIFQPEVVQRFLALPMDDRRPLGFDRPALENSSSGSYFSKRTVGHLGFTGTSFWVDLERAIIVVLLTNRVHPSRNNEGIKTFRPELHDAVMKNI